MDDIVNGQWSIVNNSYMLTAVLPIVYCPFIYLRC